MTNPAIFEKGGTEIKTIPRIKIAKINPPPKYNRWGVKIEFKKIPPIKERQKYNRIFDFVIQNLRRGSGKLWFPRIGKQGAERSEPEGRALERSHVRRGGARGSGTTGQSFFLISQGKPQKKERWLFGFPKDILEDKVLFFQNWDQLFFLV